MLISRLVNLNEAFVPDFVKIQYQEVLTCNNLLLKNNSVDLQEYFIDLINFFAVIPEQERYLSFCRKKNTYMVESEIRSPDAETCLSKIKICHVC